VSVKLEYHLIEIMHRPPNITISTGKDSVIGITKELRHYATHNVVGHHTLSIQISKIQYLLQISTGIHRRILVQTRQNTTFPKRRECDICSNSKWHTFWFGTDRVASSEIAWIFDSDSVSFMTVSLGALWSITGVSLSIASMFLGLVSLNSTESATDGVEKDEQLDGEPGLRASSPKMCSGVILELLSTGWWLVALVVGLDILFVCMLQSAQARSSSVSCWSFVLTCEHKQCNQTNKFACMWSKTVQPNKQICMHGPPCLRVCEILCGLICVYIDSSPKFQKYENLIVPYIYYR